MELEGKQFEILKWALVIIAVFMVLRLLNKFGLLGKTDDEKNADKLATSGALNDLSESGLLKAAQTVTGTKTPSKKQLLNLMPNKDKFGKWIIDIYGADKIDDDEDAVFNVFKSMYSQFEISSFATTFKAVKGIDLYVYLNSFMDKSELAEIYKIIASKKPA